MKKIATLLTLVFAGGVVVGQELIAEPQKTNTIPINSGHGQMPGVHTSSTGDTLLYFEGYNFFVGDPVDAAVFTFQDISFSPDTVASAFQSTPFANDPGFVFFYKLDANNDTINYIGATSWYNPIGTADNWFTFGPVTIPSTGATLRWQHAMPHHSYRDGYKVLVSTDGLNPGDFQASSAIYSVADKSPLTAGDSVLGSGTYQAVDFPPTYFGQQVYLAFHHNAHDEFILYLDEITITEGLTGVEEESAAVAVSASYPNPAQDHTSISYTLKNTENVNVTICNHTGKQVMSIIEGRKGPGAHNVKIDLKDLASGIYYYTVTAGASSSTEKMVVIR